MRADRIEFSRHAAAWLLVGAVLVIVGVALASWTQTRGGTVTDVRFKGPDGTVFSALLYRPPTATVAHPAPGILAVHGYINTRETQSPFAIEFARRGYVVLALDQRGHGYSDGGATTKGFGGPEGLAYLRTLPFVDRRNIGLEGHSMGGWAVLAAAAAMPGDYSAMVLEGSSVGAPFARDGTPVWPRNVAVVFSRFDEFAPLMWGVPRAADVGASAKLRALFGATGNVMADRTYGSIPAGTARLLRTPAATHPGDHLSTVAVADAADWFSQTLVGGQPRAATDQIWWVKEAGTGLALLGLAALVFGTFDLLLRLTTLKPRAIAADAATAAPGSRRTLWFLTAFIPAVTYYCALLVLPPPVAVSPVFPQAITNWLMVWAIGNAAVALGLGKLLRRAPIADFAPMPPILPSIALAVGVIAVAYGVVCAAAIWSVDFRFWVVAVKPLSRSQLLSFCTYVVPFTVFIGVTFHGFERILAPDRGSIGRYLSAVGALSLGFLALTGGQYVLLFATGALPLPFEALNVIVAIQFVPLLAGLACLAVYCERRTSSFLPGALIGGLFVTWYMVAGTATHFAT